MTAEIEIGGQVISQATASGSYNIATAEAVFDPITGTWVDANTGG